MKNTPRRSIIRQSIGGSVNISRSTIIAETPRRRDAQSVRCPDYQSQCAATIYNFLANHNYPKINPNILIRPSSRTFQEIFKYIVEFISPFNFTRFEDEVLQILRQLKYPFLSELNRSQMKAITPHSWPVLQSMLMWLVELVENLNNVDGEEDEFEKLYKDFTVKSYRKFMEGEDEDSTEKDEFYRNVDGLLRNHQNTIDRLRENEEILDGKIEALKFNDNSDIRGRIEEMEQKSLKVIRLCERIPQ